MDWKTLSSSSEVLIGAGLVIAGICAQACGFHDVFTMALIPFGVGVALSEVITQMTKKKRERVRIRVRHDDK